MEELIKRLENKKYKGVWYGAKNHPFSQKELLDKIIVANGRGFTIKVKTEYSDNLFDEGKIVFFLADEENVGKLKLNNDHISYLLENMDSESYISKKLSA